MADAYNTGPWHAAGYDGNGNVSLLVDGITGAESGRYEYGPFGELLRATGPMGTNNFIRFSTKRQDPVTDMLCFGYRDLKDGRWLSRDPIEEQGGLNLYGFVENDGVNFIDRLGLDRFFATVVGKSYIAPIGPQTQPLPWGNSLAQSLYGLKENPTTDAKDSVYRLYSKLTLNFECCNGKINFKDRHMRNAPATDPVGGTFDSDGGKEAGGLLMGSFKGAIGFKKESDSKWLFSIDVVGAPAPAAEVSFQIFKPRKIVFIWYSIRGYIRCDGNQGYVSADINGSKFPSHRLWINGTLTKTIVQGDLSNLWKEGQPHLVP